MNNTNKINYVLECINLSKSFQDAHSHIHILDKINFQVKSGELIAIVGNSGSGKSTLLHLLGGLDKPSAGKVFISNRHLALLSEKEKCSLRNESMGFIYQFHHLLPEFTALENVAMPLLLGNKKLKKGNDPAKELLVLVGLEKRLHHKIGELSGGERQRVAIARALVTKPLCVLADEPTGNLDPNNAEKVLELFIHLQKLQQTSVIMVTHDHHIAKKADKIFTLANGKLLLEK